MDKADWNEEEGYIQLVGAHVEHSCARQEGDYGRIYYSYLTNWWYILLENQASHVRFCPFCGVELQ